MAIYGYTKNYKLIKPEYDSDTWHDYEYDNLDTIDAVLSAIYASGNWKGFWANNTAYAVGDVVIDKATDNMYKVMVEHTTSGGSFAEEQTNHPDYYELWSPNNLAESWAIKTDGKVSNEDYSAKAYAISSGLISEGSAKEWAITASGHATSANTSAEQAAESANNAINSVSSASTSATNAATSAELSQSWAVSDTLVNGTDYSAKHYANQANTDATNAASSATASANSATSASASAQAAQDVLDDIHGLIATPIGTIFQSIYVDESQDIARALNGQLISSTKFTGFREWLNTVQTAIPSLFTTEVNWQAEKTNSKLGQCGKFVVDDTAGTIRLPCVVNAQGLTDLTLIGGIKAESLPNFDAYIFAGDNGTGITDDIGIIPEMSENTASGAVEVVSNTKKRGYSGVGYDAINTKGFRISPSITSSTYQNNAPVQQEAIQYPYYIQVATGVEETLPAIREYKINTPFFFGQSMYSDVAPDNASWLVSNGQYNARSVYPDYYDWLLEQMNAGVSGFVASTATYTDYDFVINTTDQTFRLPLKNGQEGVFANGVKGNGMTLGLTNGTANGGLQTLYYYGGVTDGGTARVDESCYDKSIGTEGAGGGAGSGFNSNRSVGITTDPSKSGIIVDKTVPSGWNLYYYIGDTVQDASLINAGAVLGQLSTRTNSVEAAAASMPSDKYIELTLGASGQTYTAPANGWFIFDKAATAANQYAALYNTGKSADVSTLKSIAQTVIPIASNLGLTIPALKGDIVHLDYTLAGNTMVWRFVYAEGNQ